MNIKAIIATVFLFICFMGFVVLKFVEFILIDCVLLIFKLLIGDNDHDN